ncbi:mediator complex subunit Med5-domain-containing protein [Abortiporus biennis]|nr:mediator complex subunit Med5-domain-containing protein [Abortiporus biennis]
MSLSELTRNAFQSGVAPSKWIKLCKLFVSKNLAHVTTHDIEVDISNSVLILFKNYPGDPILQNYLRSALQDGSISLPIFLSTFLAGAPGLHNPATLDMLCNMAIDFHNASGSPPVGPILTGNTLKTISDAMSLVKTAQSTALSPSDQLLGSTSALLIVLLTSPIVADVSQVSPNDVISFLAEANDLMNFISISTPVRAAIEQFISPLTMYGGDAKAVREAQMHTMHLALTRGEVIVPNSDTDIISCGLLLQSLILRRASEFGSGDGSHVIALLVALVRWSSWSPQIFYTQMILSAVHGLSQSALIDPGGKSAALWRVFITGRMPYILKATEKSVELDGIQESDWRSAIHTALANVLQQSDLLQRCDTVAQNNADPAGNSMSHGFTSELLHQLLSIGLVEQSFVSAVNPNLANEFHPRIQYEAQESNTDIEVYLENKLLDGSPEDSITFMDKVWRDPCCHNACAEVIRKRFISAATSLDVEALSEICKMLYLHPHAIDIVALHVKLSDLLASALAIVEDYDCETVGDPQTAVSHLGDIVLFLELTFARFNLSSELFVLNGRKLNAALLASVAVSYPVEALESGDASAFTAWFKALFDNNSEGIDDAILRSTRPKTLLKISATLFCQAIQMCLDRKMEKETMSNGISYFLGPLLNWTLGGVVQVLLSEISHRGLDAPIHIEVLQTLLLSPSCPKPVLRLSANAVLRTFAHYKKPPHPPPQTPLDVPAIQQAALKALGRSSEGSSSLSINNVHSNPREAIREALASAQSGKIPTIDIDRYILLMPPTSLLSCLWSELLQVSSTTMIGEIQVPKRLGTFIISYPRSPRSPPLLPIFIHVVLPNIIATVDGLIPAIQSMAVELLVSLISSSLMAALHLEYALLSVCNDQRFVLGGQSVSALARRLGKDLRRRSSNSHTSMTVVERLASSHSFVTNFPTFMAEQ